MELILYLNPRTVVMDLSDCIFNLILRCWDYRTFETTFRLIGEISHLEIILLLIDLLIRLLTE